ncbi:MAG: PAS domain-containing protein [Phormidesmis sp.]
MDGCVSFWNKGAETLYGWTSEEAIERNANQLVVHRRKVVLLN